MLLIFFPIREVILTTLSLRVICFRQVLTRVSCCCSLALGRCSRLINQQPTSSYNLVLCLSVLNFSRLSVYYGLSSSAPEMNTTNAIRQSNFHIIILLSIPKYHLNVRVTSVNTDQAQDFLPRQLPRGKT